MNYQEVIENAKKNIGTHCKVCPQCNGVSCKGVIPGPGGKSSGIGFIRNFQAFKDISINMDTLHNVLDPDISIELFGEKFELPVFAAPVGAVQLHYSDLYDDLKYSQIIIKGSKNAGSIGFTGDGVDSRVFESTADAIKECGGHAIPTIKPWSKDEVIEKIRIAEDANSLAVAMDIDAAGLSILAAQGKPVYPVSEEVLRQIIASTELPFIVKGIMTPQAALKAADAGAYAIIVSNHGGRVLDDTPSTLSVLPEIVQAVKGKVKIFIDGGIRTGLDVFKAIALGADAVLIARPFVTAVYGGAEEGVELLYNQISSELKNAMLMTGCKNISSINQNHVRKL